MYVVNLKELPEAICVETRFISKDSATKMSLNSQSTVQCSVVNMGAPMVSLGVKQKPKLPVVDMPATRPPVTVVSSASIIGAPQIPRAITNRRMSLCAPSASLGNINHSHMNLQNREVSITTKSIIAKKDSATMTDPKTPNRDSFQQTDCQNAPTESVGIQCDMEDILYEFDMNVPVLTEDEATVPLLDMEEETQKFLEFVQANTLLHNNRMRECLLCGEIAKSTKYFYGHMEIHRGGSQVLCVKCGVHLEHESLLQTHYCSKSKKLDKPLLRCPYYRCSVTALSPLELYDHINEHIKYKAHKCTACNRSFCTNLELMRHISRRFDCLTTAKRKRSNLYGLKSSADRVCRNRIHNLNVSTNLTAMGKTRLPNNSKTCQICLKKCFKSFALKRHTAKCIKKYEERLNGKNSS